MKTRFLFVIMLMTAVVTASARISKGKAGLNAQWEFDGSGTLTISGTGDVNLTDYRKKMGTVLGSLDVADIKTVVVGEGITSVAGLYNLDNLTSVTLPSSLRVIGNGAFSGCKSLSNITIPGGVKVINQYAFSTCGLTEVTLNEGVERINQDAFSSCQQLRHITLPQSLRKIGCEAFRQCENLEELVIPNGVDTLGRQMFEGCKGLKRLVFPDKQPSVVDRGQIDPAYIKIYGYLDGYRLMDAPKIESIRSHSGLCPKYVIDNVRTECYMRPEWSSLGSSFAENVLKTHCPWVDRIVGSFSYFAYDKFMGQLGQWQQKKKYETTAQYQQRVTEANRQVQVQKIVAELQQEYAKERLKYVKRDNWKISNYDADYNTFIITLEDGAHKTAYTTTAKVPLSEAPAFESSFKDAIIQPQYGVVGDSLALLACDFKLGNKTYHSAETYQNDPSASLAITLPPLQVDLSGGLGAGQGALGNAQSGQGGGLSAAGNALATNPASPVAIDRSIDTNIPVGSLKSNNTFAVIIGNENYQRVAKVAYAANDAKTFAAYCQKTLGLPQKNIRAYQDATYGTMLAALKDIQNIAKAYKGNLDVIFYYAGHGVPSEADQSAFLLPVDADGTQTEVCLSTKRLYQTLNSLGAQQVVVLMDACFSGAQRGDGMLASARGVALKVKSDTPTGNMVVFTAANGEQTAYPYKEKGHGLFTYYILKKLQDTKGNTTLGDLTDYVSEQVGRQSVVENKHSQTPTVIPATALSQNWRQMKLH